MPMSHPDQPAAGRPLYRLVWLLSKVPIVGVFFGELLRPGSDAPAYFCLNVALIWVFFVLAFGVPVVFFTALAMTPIVLVTLVVLTKG